MDFSKAVKKKGIEKAIDYLYKDPMPHALDAMDWADKIAGDSLEGGRRKVRSILENPDDPYYGFVERLFTDIDPHVMKTFVNNFLINATLEGRKKQNALSEKYGCNIPWTMVIDPTTACNLNCIGCWAAGYGHQKSLTYEEIDDIIRQSNELGIYFFIFTGGEPLVRHKDILRLCEEHNDCEFMAFTNATFIDEEFAKNMQRLGNFVPTISLEGNRETTDSRRGEGVYDRVMAAIDLLKKYKLPYGISSCYTSQNYKAVTSDEYYDALIKAGAYYIWYFHYMPIGNDADPDLLPTPDQREYVMKRISYLRTNKPLFAIDFQNDGRFVNGCIAGGKNYFHINAEGAIEPCVFIHYSDSNIRDKTLLEAFQSPLFMAYHDNMPFNDNHLQPCPMLENPNYIKSWVDNLPEVQSSDYESPESVEHLYAKTKPYADAWAPRADKLWKELQEEKAEREAAAKETK